MIKTILFDIDDTIYAEKNAKLKAEIEVSKHIANEASLSFNEIHDAFRKSKWHIINSTEGYEKNDRKLWYDHLIKNLDLNVDAKLLAKLYWDTMISNISLYFLF